MKAALLLSSFILFSCAHQPKKSLQSYILQDGSAQHQKIRVKDKTEARRIIHNKYNYLKILFEQSVDPYYGQPKWSASCLAENNIGSVVENDVVIFNLSSLVLKDGKEGFCSSEKNSERKNILYVFCTGDDSVNEYRWNSKIVINPENVDFCKK